MKWVLGGRLLAEYPMTLEAVSGWKGEGSQTVQGAFGLLQSDAWNGLQVDHGRLDIAVPQQPLDGLEVVVRKEQVTCEGVPESVRRNPLRNASPRCGLLDGGLFGDEGRGGHQAGHRQLLEAAGDAKAAGAGLVGDLHGGAAVSFADAEQGALQSVDRVGDGAEEADLAFGFALGDGDGDGLLVDIETEIECNRFHGVVVSSHSHDESERIPRRVRGRSCGSAHPATRVTMNGNHTAFFNPSPTHGRRATVSHKV